MTEGWAGDTGTLQDRKERSWFGFSMESLIGPCFSFGSVRYSIGPCFSFGSRLQVPECAEEEKDGDDDGRGDDGGQRGGARRGRHRIGRKGQEG